MPANFAFVNFREHLGDVEDEVAGAGGFEFSGEASSVKEFNISGIPRGDGYLLLQTYDVGVYSHEIKINDLPLAGSNIPRHPAANRWQTWMEHIPAGRLRQGKNKIQIIRGDNAIVTGTDKGDDNFLIQGVTIHWREEA